ncbi:iron ABC transporter ATP-binding protein [Archaeoglobales archaeon ex4484_92]|nr:MAG: iron ABC transporter ATP-binding protein [Archaeoglobales archaeon ex4484_92]
MIKVRSITFGYNSKKVLDEINLEIRRGEIVVLLGPNGSGKTTLLKCIAGILKPEGAVYVDGKSITSVSRKELAKVIGYVPQRGDVSFLTVFDTILLGREPHIGWETREEDYKITEEIIRIFGLEDLASRKLNEISGGELQLVLIARAFAQQPKYILLDEPTNNLDLRNRIKVVGILKSFVRKRNMSAIIAMHDLNLASLYADRILMIKNGRIFASGGIEVLNKENIKAIYGVDVEVVRMNGKVVILPAIEIQKFQRMLNINIQSDGLR